MKQKTRAKVIDGLDEYGEEIEFDSTKGEYFDEEAFESSLINALCADTEDERDAAMEIHNRQKSLLGNTVLPRQFVVKIPS